MMQTKDLLKKLIDLCRNKLNKTEIDDSGTNSCKIGNTLIQWGYLTNVTVPATSYDSYTVSFDIPFKERPEVTATPRGNYNISCQVSSSSEAQFVLNVRSGDGAERTSRSFSWIAVGKWR